MTTPPSLKIDAQGRIDEDLHCSRCGYNLRSARGDGACPECGQPVAASLSSRLLSASDPRWLLRVARGVDFLLISASAAITCAAIVLGEFYNRVPLAISAAVGVTGFVFGALGVWLLTSPEPGASTWRDRLAPGAMASYMVLFGAAVGLWTLGTSHVAPRHRTDALAWGAIGIAAPGVVFLLLHVRRLAQRVPDLRLAQAAQVVAIAMLANVAIILALGLGLIQRVLLLFAPDANASFAVWRLSYLWQVRLALLLGLLIVLALAVLTWFGWRLRWVARQAEARP